MKKNPSEDSTTLNRYAFYISVLNFTKQAIMDIWIYSILNRLIEDDFNIPIIQWDRSSQENASREAFDLNDIIDQMNLTDIYRTFPPNTIMHSFLRSPSNFLNNTTNKAQVKSLKKYRELEWTSCILSDHKRIKLQINDRRCIQSWRLKSTFF